MQILILFALSFQFLPLNLQIFAIFPQKVQFWTIFHFWKWKMWENFFTMFSPNRDKIIFLAEYYPMTTWVSCSKETYIVDWFIHWTSLYVVYINPKVGPIWGLRHVYCPENWIWGTLILDNQDLRFKILIL